MFQKSPVLGQEGEGNGPPQRLRGKPKKTSSASGLTPASKGGKRGRRDIKWRSMGWAVCCGPETELEATKSPQGDRRRTHMVASPTSPGASLPPRHWPHLLKEPGRLASPVEGTRGSEDEEEEGVSSRQRPEPTMTSLRLESLVPHHGQFRGASPSEHMLSESQGASRPWLIRKGPSSLKPAPNPCSTPAPTEGPGHPGGRSPRGSPGRGVSPSALVCTLGILVGSQRGPSRWCRTGQGTSGLRGGCWPCQAWS